MGQILSRILRCIFSSSSKKQIVFNDLEQGLSQTQTDHHHQFPPSSSSSSSSATSSCLQFQQHDDDLYDDEIVKEEITSEIILSSTHLIDDDQQPLSHQDVDYCVSEQLHQVITVKDDDHEQPLIHQDVDYCVSGQLHQEITVKEVVKEEIRWIKHYNNGQKILLVGEGDFSFSSSLATAFISASNIIATSLDSLEFLRKNYRKAISNLKNLEKRGSMVMHEVNVEELANHPLLKYLKFDRIIYNFPLAGFFHHESRQSQILRNQRLVATFMENARKLLHVNGEIHITHKCNGFFLDWNLKRLGSNSGLRLVGESPFKYHDYPGYSTKCGFGGDNFFNCNPSKTYKFGIIPN